MRRLIFIAVLGVSFLGGFSLSKGKFLDFSIAIAGAAVGGFIAFGIAKWQFDTTKRQEDVRNKELLGDVFDQVKIEIRDNRNYLIKLHTLLSSQQQNRGTLWDYAQQITLGFKSRSYELLLQNGLAEYMPPQIAKTLFSAHSILEGVSNLVREGDAASKHIASNGARQDEINQILKNAAGYSLTAKKYHDYAVKQLWGYKPGEPVPPLAPKKDMPFSTELASFISDNPDVLMAITTIEESDGELLSIILLSYSPEFENSEVIGVFRFSAEGLTDKKKPLFIQDYIVNGENGFVLYSDIPSRDGITIRPIGEFARIYGAGKYYGTADGKLDHEYFSVQELPKQVRSYAKTVMKEHTKKKG